MNYKYITIFTILFLIACSSNSNGVSTKLVQAGSQDNAENCLSDAPKWFSDPKSGEAIGVGESRDLAFSRTKAETDASIKLGAQINRKVNNLINSVAGENNAGIAKQISQGTEIVVSTTVQGMGVDKYYLCPKMVGGTEGYQSFALMSVDIEEAIERLREEFNRQKQASNNTDLNNFLDDISDQLDTTFN